MQPQPSPMGVGSPAAEVKSLSKTSKSSGCRGQVAVNDLEATAEDQAWPSLEKLNPVTGPILAPGGHGTKLHDVADWVLN